MINIVIDRENSTPLYKQISNSIEEYIKSGEAIGGEKLPSKRTMSKELGVSKNTVIGAYKILAEKKYIIPVERQGHFIRNISES